MARTQLCMHACMREQGLVCGKVLLLFQALHIPPCVRKDWLCQIFFFANVACNAPLTCSLSDYLVS